MAIAAALAWLLVSGSVQPCFGETKRGWKKAWIASVAALVAVNVLDVRSSAGRYESNPLMRDPSQISSAGRAALVKSAGTGGLLLLQFVLLKKNRSGDPEKRLTLINFTAASAVGAVALRNSTIARPPSPGAP